MKATAFLMATVALSMALTLGIRTAAPRQAEAAACMPTSFGGLTAALVNPAGTVSGTVNATGCDIGIFYDQGRGNVSGANVFGALHYGIVAFGDVNAVNVDIMNSSIHDIGDTPFNGNQRGVAIYYRAFIAGRTSGKIWNNNITNYQKGGIVANGRGTDVSVRGNTLTGFGPVAFIAQNGIQVGYGGTASIMQNTVTGHSYTGTSTVSGGIIVVGGAGYGVCPGAVPCPYSTNVQIDKNVVVNNDVGVFLTNIDGLGNAPAVQTNIKVINNTISSSALQNNYGGFGYQAGISDVGNNDKLINNTISGAGYVGCPLTAYCVAIDADPSFTNRAKVHANK